ncbi:MAG: ATP-dependent RecD-like DNA helicase, partial [Deltaproteobacteria bacterium]|nr:ATP-dependent RecD-like DNA helicase [Deltaproteobacteria bacterium]
MIKSDHPENLNLFSLMTLQGQVERVTYVNDETNYTVLKLKVKGARDLVTVVGSLAAVTPGEILQLTGTWSQHPKFGEQFNVKDYRSIVPAEAGGIEKYLGSGLVKGIGPVMAKRIVAVFGADTLKIIEESPEKLFSVAGIGRKRVGLISQAWQEQKEIREVMIFLQGHGVSTVYAVRIFKRYGREAVDVVTENPYRLAEDIFGIGFITADKIAANMGIPKDSPARCQAGLLYVLKERGDDGHVYYPEDQLLEETRDLLDIPLERLAEALSARLAAGDVAAEEKIVPQVHDGRPFGRPIYLARLYAAERNAASRLSDLGYYPSGAGRIDAEAALAWVAREMGLTLAPKQAEAVKAALNRKVMVITGGPGTGKTTIVKAILRVFESGGCSVLLAAPTGRAAKRLAESCGCPAKTIHRLLEFSPKDRQFKKNEEHPLNVDVIIVDEASMIDIALMNSLVRAIPLSGSIILVGDVDQLPSVGPGNVLKDVIYSHRFPVVRLNQIFRQAESSLIVVNAHLINRGEFPIIDVPEGKLTDFYFIEQEDPAKVISTILKLLMERIPQRFGFDPVEDVQVLTPMHKGLIGAGNLNQTIQTALNPQGDQVVRGGRVYRVGDKVMQIRNNYDKDVFNGDMGRIC